jgi:hypothetical protein
MSEFKFVQWGKGTPVDYQRLNAMMLNEQYLKDVVDATPKGILLWKQIAEFTADPTGGTDSIPNLSNLTFDVEENRIVSLTFYPGTIAGISPIGLADLSFGFLLDDATTPVKYAGGYWVFDGRGPSTTVAYVTPVALSKGTHTVSVILRGNTGMTNVNVGYGGSNPLLIVRDEGRFVSASS